MDNRRVPVVFHESGEEKKREKGNKYIKSLWINVIFSVILLPFVLIGENHLLFMSFFYGILSFFLMMSMIDDFSSVLLDIRDHSILLPRPVDPKTISTAKILHVLIYLTFLTISIAALPLLAGWIRHGIMFFLMSFVNMIMIALFIVGLTTFLYMLILRFFDGEKLKDLITYIQIVFSVVVFVGSQLFFRFLQALGYDFTIDFQWRHLFFFPFWYSANIEMVLNQTFEPIFLFTLLLSVVIPILSIGLYIKFNDRFEKNLRKLNEHINIKKNKYRTKTPLLSFLLCRSREERAFFQFASAMMKRERDFKLKIYPVLGFIIIFPFIFISNHFMYSDPDTQKSLSYLTIYISLVLIPNLLFYLSFSSKAKSAWIYRVTPLRNPKPIFTGTIKAFLARIFVPVYMILSIIFIFIYGIRIIPDLFVVFVNALNYLLLCFLIIKK